MMELKVLKAKKKKKIGVAKTAGAVEYIDCTSAEEQDPLQQVSWICH